MNHTRHMGIFQVPSTFSVTLIGAGGIGATTALTLAKMGVRILQIFDDDTVSEREHSNAIACMFRRRRLESQLPGPHTTAVLGRDRALPGLSARYKRPQHSFVSGHLRGRQHYRSPGHLACTEQPGQRVGIGLLTLRMAAEEFQHFLL